MTEDVISIVLRAENDYHFAMNNAVEEAEKYAEDSKQKQGAYLDELRRDFHQFERAQRDRFEKTLFESMLNMDEENAAVKAQLKNCQVEKAKLISKRLKKEVLMVYGDS